MERFLEQVSKIGFANVYIGTSEEVAKKWNEVHLITKWNVYIDGAPPKTIPTPVTSPSEPSAKNETL
jgi:hypothetical protein